MGKMIQLLMEEKCYGRVKKSAEITERKNGPDNYFNAWKFTLDHLIADSADELNANSEQVNPFLVPHNPENANIFGSRRPAAPISEYTFREETSDVGSPSVIEETQDSDAWQSRTGRTRLVSRPSSGSRSRSGSRGRRYSTSSQERY